MEEQVLKLRDDNHSLKKTVREQEIQLKKLQTKLIRTEEAARKAVRKVGSGAFSSNATTDLQSQLLQTELRVGELEEKNEQLHQKAERERQKMLHFQKLAKEYKAKTDSTAKLRNFRNSVKGGSGSAARKLRESQEFTTSSTGIRPGSAGSKALRVDHSGTGTGTGSTNGISSTTNFQLVDIEGIDFILDSDTLKLYQWKGGKLHPSGLLVDGVFAQSEVSRDLLLALDQYLKSHRKRLIELYEELDARQKGVVPLERIVSLVSNVLGDPSEAELDYFRACLDVNNKGKVSYADMMSALRDVVTNSQAADGGGLRFSTVCDKVLNVLLFRKQEAKKAFRKHCNENGHLSFRGISKYIRALVPTLSSSDVRICLSTIRKQDVQAQGKLLFVDILITFGAIEKNKIPKKPKAKAAEKSIREVQKKLGFTEPAYQLGLADLPSDKQFSDIAVARRQIDRLENRYSDAQKMVEDMKGVQKRLVEQLEETQTKLAEERKHAMMLEVEQKKLVFDIQGARDLKPMLEQAQKDILVLEKENHQLMSSAIKAPQAALNELKNARWDAIEHQKHRNAAELRETELRRELASMKKQLSDAGSYSGADMLSVRVERDNAVKEISRLNIELEAVKEKLKVYQALSNEESKKAQIDPEDSIESSLIASGPVTGSEKEMAYELKHLQEAYAKQTLELEKIHLVLRHEEERCADLIAENESLRNQLESARASYDKRLAAYQNELNMKQERISKLEAKLCLSSEVIDQTRSQKAKDDDILQDIELKENEDLLVLSIHSLSYIDTHAFDSSTSSFLVVDFYEHEPQTSDVVQGLKPRLDTSFQFVVAVDNFFISYMNSRNVVVEINKVAGLDYQVVGAAEIPLRQMLSEKYSGDLRATDIFGDGDKLIGKMFYSIEFQNNLIRELKVDANIPNLDNAPGYMATGIEVVVEGCTDLVLPDTRSEDIVAYCNYRLLDFSEHDTVFGTGKDPVFKDKHFLQAKWSPELRDSLFSGSLELKCFHDGEALEKCFIGECRIDMKALADGIPIEGTYTLVSGGEEVGQVKIMMQWIDKMASKKDDLSTTLQTEKVEPEAETSEPRQIEEYTALSEMIKMESSEAHISGETSEVLNKDESALVEDPVVHIDPDKDIEIVSESDMMDDEDEEEEEEGSKEIVGDLLQQSVMEEIKGVPEAPKPEESNSFVELAAANMKLPDLSKNIVIHISKVILAESMMENAAIEQICVVFDFLTTFVDAKSQCTPMKPKISSVVDFSHTQDFCIDGDTDNGLREHVLTLIADGNEVDSSIPFCLVAEGSDGQATSDSKFQDVAYCEVSLLDIFKAGQDISEREIAMQTPEGLKVATLFLSVFAVGALQSIVN